MLPTARMRLPRRLRPGPGPRRFGAAVVASVALLSAAVGCTSGARADRTSGQPSQPQSLSRPAATTPTPSPTSSAGPASPTTKPGKPVHVSSVQYDGAMYGIGMPLIIRFSVSPTSRGAFEKAAKVTVNGRDAGGAWYWEQIYKGEPVEAHYRPRLYWPAHSKIHVDLPVTGLSAGKGLTYENGLTLDYRIGASHISVISARDLTMKVYTDGTLVKTIPVSLGAAKTPTMRGVKVVMEKRNPQRMQGPGYDELVPYSVRITLSGEFIHDAYWNTNIGRISTSNGCTNLRVADSIWFYKYAQIGDVAQYPDAPGDVMPAWDGYGDWNLSWPEWQSGGSVGP